MIRVSHGCINHMHENPPFKAWQWPLTSDLNAMREALCAPQAIVHALYIASLILYSLEVLPLSTVTVAVRVFP